MKNTSLSMALAASIAGVAGLASIANAQSAMYLNPDGMGQVLIYPYYTVNNNQATLISVVNTTNQTKAVKVRFLEGRNSQEVLDFNLYLSPFDVWTAALTDLGNPDGPGVLTTTDTSCTAPDIIGRAAANGIPASSVAFRNFQYAANSKDAGPAGLDRTREGHIEIIEMGNVVNNGDTDDLFTELLPNGQRVPRNLRDAIKHGANGVPANCAAVRAAWDPNPPSTVTNHFWRVEPSTDMTPPTGGLFGAASIVNVERGTIFAYNADAVDGFYLGQGTLTGGQYWNTLHTDPSNLNPTLASAANQPGGAVVSDVFVNGSLVEMQFPTGRDAAAVSALFMYRNLMNEISIDSALGSNSEWVVTFPTKRLHIERQTFVPGSLLGTRNHTVLQRLRPFTDWVDSSGNNRVFDANGSCEPVSFARWDREEGPILPGTEAELDFSPRPPGTAPTAGPQLCYEAQVVSFNQSNTGEGATNTPSKILGSRYARNINTGVEAGWVNLTLGVASAADPFNLGNSRGNYLLDGPILATPAAGAPNPSKTGTRLFGLPATGFWVMEVNRGGDAVSNYSAAWRHRGGRAFGPYTETIRQNGFVPNCTTTVIDPTTGAQTIVSCPNWITEVQ